MVGAGRAHGQGIRRITHHGQRRRVGGTIAEARRTRFVQYLTCIYTAPRNTGRLEGENDVEREFSTQKEN